MTGWFALFLAALVLGGCSRTAPDTQWPPPGPADGLPYAPLPDDGEASEPEAPAAPLAAPPVVAIDGTLPTAPPTMLNQSHTCMDKECKLAGFLPDPGFAKAVPSGSDAPGALWLEDVAAGSVVILPRHHELDLFLLALSGDALASGDDGGAVKLEAWTVMRAPGLGVNVKAGKAGAKLVVGLVVKTGTLAAAIDRAKQKPFQVRWKKRPAPLVHGSLTTSEDLSWGSGAFHARIGFGGETPIPGSWSVLLAAAGAEINEHDHPTWEHIAILDGAGTMKVGGRGHAVKPGAVFALPPGEKHAFSPAGSTRLLAVQMYAPSGPEQRFVGLSAAEKAKK